MLSDMYLFPSSSPRRSFQQSAQVSIEMKSINRNSSSRKPVLRKVKIPSPRSTNAVEVDQARESEWIINKASEKKSPLRVIVFFYIFYSLSKLIFFQGFWRENISKPTDIRWRNQWFFSSKSHSCCQLWASTASISRKNRKIEKSLFEKGSDFIPNVHVQSTRWKRLVNQCDHLYVHFSCCQDKLNPRIPPGISLCSLSAAIFSVAIATASLSLKWTNMVKGRWPAKKMDIFCLK